MKKTKYIEKRIAVLGLAMIMIISQVPVAAFAAEPVSEAETEETEVASGVTKAEEPVQAEEPAVDAEPTETEEPAQTEDPAEAAEPEAVSGNTEPDKGVEPPVGSVQTGTLLGNAADGYYVNLPASNTLDTAPTIDLQTLLNDHVTSLKIYDDGGKDGNYSKECKGFIILHAPTGYRLKMSGTLWTESGRNSDDLSAYNGTNYVLANELFNVCSSSDGAETAFGPYVSSGNDVLVEFYAYMAPSYEGFEMTAELVSTATEYNITCASAVGGSIGTIVNGNLTKKARMDQNVTINAEPFSGYYFNGVTVSVNGSSVTVPVDGGDFISRTAAFTMFAGDVTVTPTFTNDPADLYIRMPVKGTKNLSIPNGITSFKIYDDGGADGDYSPYCNGTLTLTAPERCVLKLSGTAAVYVGLSSGFEAYDGASTGSTRIKSGSYSYDDGVSIYNEAVTTGRSITFQLNGTQFTRAGLDLVVTVIDSTPMAVNVNDPESGGRVIAKVNDVMVNSASVNTEVTLNAVPESGYKLIDLSVTDTEDNPVTVSWNGSFDNTATFKMPGSAVTVTPKFSNIMTAEGGVFINMPRTGTTTLDASDLSGISSFKLYDDGGADGDYSPKCNGTLVLTASEGNKIRLEGRVATYTMDKLIVYDGADTGANKLKEHTDNSKPVNISVVSSGQSLTVYLKTYDATSSGLDLTVNIFDHEQTFNIYKGDSTGGDISISVNGSPATEAYRGQTVTVTAEPDEGYRFDGITVIREDGETVETSGAWDTGNKAAFTMPEGNVTVTPVFSKGEYQIDYPAKQSTTKSVSIPQGAASVLIKGSNLKNAGNLELTAPKNRRIRLTRELSFVKYSVGTNTYTLSIDRGGGHRRTISGKIEQVGDSYAKKYQLNETSTGNVIKINSVKLNSTYKITFNLVAVVGRPIEAATGLSHGSITPDRDFASDGETVTVLTEPDEGYAASFITYNDGSDHTVTPDENDEYKFKVSKDSTAATITVSADFLPSIASDGFTIGDISSRSYTGSALTPDVVVKKGNTTLTKGIDYTVSPETCTDAGDHTITITGIGNYAGTVKKTFTIDPVGVTLTAISDSKTYNGTEQTLTGFSSSVDDLTFADTVIASGKGTAAGSYDVTFSGVTLNETRDSTGNYVVTGTENGTLTITKATATNPAALAKKYYCERDNADRFELMGLPADCGPVIWKVSECSGSLNFTVQPSVSDNGVLSYTVGTGAAGSTGAIQIVAETQNYNDLTFNVNITLTDKIPVKPKDGSSVSLKNSTLTYGQKLSSLSFNTAEFVSDDEFESRVEGTLAWKEPDYIPAVSTTSAVWEFTPKDPSYESCEGIAAITVNKASIEGAYVTLGPGLTFNGSELTQTVSKVQLGDDDITSLCDVTDNKGTNAGKYTLKVTAKADSNYTGSVTKDFNIARKAITPDITLTGGDSYPYSGDDITPEYQVKDGETTLASTDCSAVFSDNKDVGTARLTVSAKDGGNYSFEDTVKEFTITKASHSNVEISGSAKFGQSGSLELSELIEPGGRLGSPVVSSNEFGVLNGEPVKNGTVLSYAFADDGTKVGKAAIVEIPVENSKNYQDYRIIATLNVINCDHTHTELRNEEKPTCSKEGYTGNEVCTECGYIVKRGSSIPKDPDNHSWDEGVVTKQPNTLMKGEKLYTCVCGHKRYEELPFEEPEDGRDMSDIREDLSTLSGDAAPKVEEKTNEDGSRQETVTIGGEKVSEIITAPDGKETVESKIWIGGLKASYRYTGSAIKPEFHVYDGTRKLKENTDYTVKWSKNKEVGTAEITVKFKGNYKDSKSETVSFKIDPAVLGEDITAHETAVVEKKSAQKPVPVLVWKETGKSVSAKDFNISYDPSEVKAAGTYTATITPKKAGGNFDGTTTALVKVSAKDKVLSNVKVKFDPKSYNYNGTPIEPKYSLTMGTTTLTEGKDYKRVSLTGNTNPGNATIIFEAINGNDAGYVGSKTATFKISGKKELKEGTSFTFTCPESVPYAKSGAKPSVTVTDNDNHITLKEGQDYTLSYSKNKAVTNGEKTAEVKVNGKGNYKSSVALKFAIEQQSLKASGITITAADQFTTKSKLKAPKITITDVDGKKLKAGTDYTLGTPDTSDPANTDTKGIVSVKVTGKGSYKDEAVTVSYRYEDKINDISKAKAAGKITDQAYTGKDVKLSNAELTGILTAKDKSGAAVNLLPGTHFTVKCYTNNVKKGTAKVTIQGIGDYAGTKTITFKIVQKKADYKGALVGDGWK